MAPNFASLLNKPADDVKRPVTLPEGTYFGVIQGHEFGESSQKKTPFVQFNITLSHADDDVDLEGLEVDNKKVRTTFYLTDESMYRLTDFIKSLGIETDGRTLGELIPQTTGQSVKVDLAKRPNQAGDDYFNDVKRASGLAEQAEPSDSEQVAEAQGRRRRA